MASKSLSTTIALLLTLNLLFFTLVSSSCSCPPTTPTKPKGSPPPKPKGSPPPKPKGSPPPKPKGPPPSPSKGTPPAPSKGTPPAPCPPPAPSKAPPPAPSKAPPPAPSTAPSPAPSQATCPKDTLKLGVCADLLNDLVHLIVGTPAQTSCCSLIGGLTDLDAAVCLCTAIKANVLGINLNVPVSLSLLLNYCGKKVPEGFQCA